MSRETLSLGNTGLELVTKFNANFIELYGRSGVGINVLDYGATGDGITDDTVAIQAAIAAVPSGGTLFFPDGTYMILATGADIGGSLGGLNITDSISIVLERNAELRAIQGTKPNGQIIKVSGTSLVEISGGKFYGDWTGRLPGDVAENNFCILVSCSSNVYIHDCYFEDPAGDCIGFTTVQGTCIVSNCRVERCEFVKFRRWGVWFDVTQDCSIADCLFRDNNTDFPYGGGVDVEYHGVATGVVMKNLTFRNCTFQNCNGDNGGITCNGGTGIADCLRFDGNKFENLNRGIDLDSCRNITIIGNNFDTIIAHAINSHPESDGLSGSMIIIGNTFTNDSMINLGDMTPPYYGFHSVCGTIISGNSFMDFIAIPCIRMNGGQNNNFVITNNTFQRILAPFSADKRFAQNIYLSGNMSDDSADPYAINYINNKPVPVYTSGRATTTGDPTLGTFEVGEWLVETDFVVAGYLGLVCTVAGTMGGLGDAINTICTADGSNVVIIADPYTAGINIGCYLSINGGAAVKVLAISGPTLPMSVTVSAPIGAGVGLTVVNSPATFKKWGAIEP